MLVVKAKRAIVLCHGEFGLDNFDLRDDDILICADGGAEHAARMGWRPHVVLGDLDSISDSVRTMWSNAGVIFEVYPVEKDATDSELALDYAVRMGVGEILMLGALGGRVDHSLANIFLLTKYLQNTVSEKPFPTIRILGDNQMIWLAGHHTTIHGKVGDTVSLIPLSARVTGVSTSGLYYPLQDGVLEFGSSLGNSNKMVQETAAVTVDEGILLVVHTWED